MAKGELVEMEKAEDAVKEEVKKQAYQYVLREGEEIAHIDIKSTKFISVGDIPVFRIKCSAALVTFRRGRIYSWESRRTMHFEAQVNAESGIVVGFEKWVHG